MLPRLTFLALLLALLVPAGASAAAAPDVRGVTAPGQIAAGAKLTVSVKVRAARRAAKLAVLLSTDAKRDARDRSLGSVRVARRARSAKATFSVPANVAPGRYQLLVCGSKCRAATLQVTAKNGNPGPVPPVVHPAPGPAPAPAPDDDPVPSPTATATATATATPIPTATPGTTPQPDPIPQGVPTSFDDSVAFLYEGPNKVQTGVAAGTIKPARVAVLRGSVHNRAGEGLGGVTVTVLDHPELGQTVSRADGGYDLAVNGGGPLTLSFTRDGYVGAQREVDAPWQDFATVDDLVLIAFDAKVTHVDLATQTAQVAEGSKVTDADGARTASVLFEPGTHASMVMPDGSTRPLTALDVRATEFTQGASGPDAMPGTLPASSGYTYAVELSVDQAVQAGATEVRFDKPVVNYVDNFLGFPVGGAVPTGYYDRAQGEWIAAPNGRVIKLTGVVDGKAQLDTDGDGQPDGGLGIDDAERARLAATRHVGDELWRVPMTHFTPWDHNWPYAPDPDAVPPSPPEPRVDIPGNRKTGSCAKQGSIIGCQGQTLGEELPVAGTPLKLHYDSSRGGRKTDRTMDIPLTGHSIPDSLQEVKLVVSVAGREETKTFAPKKDLTYEYVWDRKDAYGRDVQGRQPVTIKIGWVYGLRRYDTPAQWTAAFAKFGDSGEVIGQPRDEAAKFVSWRTVYDQFDNAVGSLDARGTGLGGWELDVHHAYDARMRTLYRGDGLEVGAEPVLDALADTGHAGDPRDADVAPDGSVWVANAATDQVLRFEPDGTSTVMAGSVGGGGGCENCRAKAANASAADDPFAKGFPLARPMAVALSPDGGFYIADYMIDFGLQQTVVYQVTPDGRIHKVAGCLCNGSLGDDGPAVDAPISALDLAVGDDGTLYLADYRNGRIRAVDAGGTIRTVAGGGAASADGVQGTQLHLFDTQSVETGPDGEVYFGDDGDNSRIRRLDPDGTVTTVAGGKPFNADDNGDGGPATAANIANPQGIALGADGSLYFAESERMRRVATDGTITTVAGGGGVDADGADKVPAGSVRFSAAMGVDVAPDGALYVASRSGLSRVSRPFPITKDGILEIPSKDGREVYCFDSTGRHVRTVDGLSGVAIWRFAYDDAGRLATLTDADGKVTRIERDGTGAPTAIVAPGGQRTALTVTGEHLTKAQGTTLGYDASGRLSLLIDRRGGRHEFAYDEEGRLIRDEDPSGKAQTLGRVETANGWITTLTSPEGRKTSWESGVRADGDAYMATTSPSGAKTVTSVGIDGVQHEEFPTGETIDYTQAPDPRWGYYVPVLKRLVRKAPSGRTLTTTNQRAVQLADPVDPLSVQSITDTITSNGRTVTVAYDAAARRESVTSAEGRASATTYDAKGHAVRVEPAPGVDPVSYEYDERGLLKRVAQGNQSLRWEYDAHDRPAVQIDALNRRTELTYDDADRIVAVKRPGGQTERYEYDGEGTRTAVILPGGQRHVLSRDAKGRMAGYVPAAGATVARGHNADNQLTADGVDGDQTTYGYDTGGRAAGATWADAVTEYGYDSALDRPSSLKRSGGGTTEADALTYDGDKTTQITATGTATGAFTFGYDANGFLGSTKLVSGAQTVTTALTRDKDGELTGDGPFTIARGGAGASAITGAGLNETLEQDGTGRLKSRTLTANGAQRYKLVLARTDDGKIARKTETVDGATHVFDYHYDDNGQLTQVDRDATPIERYGYDVNGNRKTRQLGEGAVETSAFDDEDRLTARGATALTYDGAGFLATRGGDHFDYSARGELLSAAGVSYRYDALNRRVARVQGAQITQYLYGDPSNPLRVTATRSPAGVLTTYHYDDNGMLFAFERNGARFFVGTDQVGSPIVVTNASGAVQDVRTYDAFGNLTAETQPAFDLPLGYAGGIDDRVTGLVRFGYRDLDTASGRWTARDPALYEGGQANLYTYVGSDPVALRDPTGLWCIGGSAYDGVGGGVTICHTDEGTSVCAEVGIGFGVAVGLDNGKLPKDGATVVAEAKANLPFFGVGISAELNDCGEVSSTGSVDAFVWNMNTDGVMQLENPVLGEGAAIKVAAKVCKQITG